MFPYSLHNPGIVAPHVVPRLSACLGVPRHYSNDQDLISVALKEMGIKHDKLLDLAEEISEATLRLLHVCGVSRLGHVLSAVSPDKVGDFARKKNEAVAITFATIQQQEPPSQQSTHTLPVGVGGA